MTKKEMITKAAESLGCKAVVDDDGDICVRYQMKNIYFMTGQDEEPYVSAILPQFADVNEGEETLMLAVCNKMTRDMKLAKMYIDQTLKSVSDSCEFFYIDMESLKTNLGHSLDILGMVRSTYARTRAELMDC